MQRRDVLMMGAGATAAQVLGAASATAGKHHHKHGGGHKIKISGGKKHPHADALQKHLLECVRTGDICIQHCIRSIASGDPTLIECLDIVNQMVAVCHSGGPVVVANSRHLKPLMKICLELCKDCETICGKHGAHHKECKACADACTEAIKILAKA